MMSYNNFVSNLRKNRRRTALILPVSFTVDEYLDFEELYSFLTEDYIMKCQDNSDIWGRSLMDSCEFLKFSPMSMTLEAGRNTIRPVR
jgi:hypothetical protein